MARHETDKEDLLRQATALVERIELRPALGSSSEQVIAGFRASGALSIFFGADPVYQFTAAGELRRAYVDGRILKASHGKLVAVTRNQSQNHVQLLHHELSDAEQLSFAQCLCDRLRALAAELDSAALAVVGQVPADANVRGRLRNWLATFDGLRIAMSPRVDA